MHALWRKSHCKSWWKGYGVNMDYNNPNILNIYQHGSRVYGTASEKSDYDYICIVEDDFFDKEILLEGNHDYHFVSKSYWIKKCMAL